MTSTTIEDRVRALLHHYGGTDACAADLLCDRHPPERTACRVVGPQLRATELTYGELRAASERFAAALADLGVAPGDRVGTLLGKSREYLITVLAIWRLGAVHVPLFTAFAPAQVTLRLGGSGAKIVVCDRSQRSKLDPGPDMPSDPPWRTIVVGERGELPSFSELLSVHPPGLAAARLGADAPLVHLYTSGTTGSPKGVVVPLRALASFHTYLEFGLDVRPDDVYWCAADPGWAYGLYYAVLAPLAAGQPTLLLDSGFSVESTWSMLSRYRVTNFAAAPTVYRALRSSPVPVPEGLRLRHAASAGEPLTPEVNEWAQRELGVLVHDHYGQTETGMVLNNHQHPDLARPLKPSSMGRPMPGWTTAVVQPSHGDGHEPAPAGTTGALAVDVANSPLFWFGGYADAEAATAEKFSADGRWYFTGDLARTDEDGDYFFASRQDDVIVMAGYRIGPTEIEAVLAGHPDVAECAVVAAPDELRGQVIEAYVVPRDGTPTGPELSSELKTLVKQKYAAHAYPRTVHFVDELPKTPSGKLQRFALRRRRERGRIEHGRSAT